MTACSVPAEAHENVVVSAADERFLAAFENGTLPERKWTHMAHVRLAWICLASAPASDALARIRAGIIRYNRDVLDRSHKYHETVTVAYCRIVADRMRSGESWYEFSCRVGDVLDSANPLLLRYYSAERLFSDEARSRFVDPDLAALPR